jgi:N-hydroxyarylamine O-acetyltransferase
VYTGRVDATDYLARIGAAADDPLDVLMARHLETVPFENLSVHERDHVPLEDEALVGKVVDRRRGGFCYELNGAFAWLLRELGHHVAYCSARVATGDGFSFPGDHMALIADGRTLVDVGFGRFAVGPLDLDSRDDQPDRAGTFTVRNAPTASSTSPGTARPSTASTPARGRSATSCRWPGGTGRRRRRRSRRRSSRRG